MLSNNKLKLKDVHTKKGYLLKYCEFLYRKYNYKEDIRYKGMPERMAFETEIWIVGEQIRKYIEKNKILKKNESNQILSDEVIKIIQTEKYQRGRESFTMLLHYFKNNPAIESLLKNLLKDEQLRGFAIIELNNLKIYNYEEQVKGILKSEKISWIRKEALRYIKNREKPKTHEYEI